MAAGDKMEMIPFREMLSACAADAAAQEHIVGVVADLLEWQCASNDEELGGRPTQVTVFHGHSPPKITVRAYLERIRDFGGCSPCCFVLALKYMDKLEVLDSAYRINSFNLHRTFLTATMVAAKFVDDFYFSNNYWAKVGGIANTELNGLEMELLFLLNFSLHMKREAYDSYIETLLRRQASLREAATVRRMASLKIVDTPSREHLRAVPAAM
ncbi:cyclin-domain-containing protein [Baffinella frigidus]|nr:cyclin-domain-containing protein [Cryptophyta sp. CCMP2293]